MVSLPKFATKLQNQLLVKALMARLSTTGFTHMALTHTIYGRPTSDRDRATVALPDSLLLPPTMPKTTTTMKNSSGSDNDGPVSKKQKATTTTPTTTTSVPTIKVLRRLHSVLENLPDVSLYTSSSNGSPADLIKEYDIVSVAPRNEGTFQAACASATAADIITLDYSGTRGFKLPYNIRPMDVQAVMDRNAAFEIHYAPALLNEKLRKALIQACHQLQSASLGKKPLILFSSGDRTIEETDAGALAFRRPGDLSNLMKVLLHFDPITCRHAVGEAACTVVQQAQARRLGTSEVSNVFVGTREERMAMSMQGDNAPTTIEAEEIPKAAQQESAGIDDGEDDNGDGVLDGFISMT